MKKFNLTYGLLLAVVFTTFIMLLPHKTFRIQGVESDLGYYYVPMARELATRFFGEEEYAPREYTWQFHGPVYPLMLLVGRKTFGPDTDQGYFIAAKWYSALAGGSIILLALLWLGMPAGLLAAISLSLTYVFVECAFSCGTDLISVAILLWAAYILQLKNLKIWIVIAAGLLFSFSLDMRHEFIVLLPFGLYYLWQRAKQAGTKPWYSFRNPISPIYLSIPFLLLIVPDMPNWNGTYNAAFKYKADDARWQDLWPEEAFTEEHTDEISESYWGYLIRKSDEKYPSLLSVLLDDPMRNLSIWARDITRGFRDIPAVWVLPFLSIAFVIALAQSGIGKSWGLFGKIALLAVLMHYFMINTFGVYVDRYYLLEIIALTFLGSIALFKLLPLGSKGTLALLITLPFFYLGGVDSKEAISRNIRFNGERYVSYSEIVIPEDGQQHAIMMSRDPGIPYNAGAEWHQFPKGVEDLHQYCLDRGVRYIYWGSKESIFRSEYSQIFDYPDRLGSEYTLVDDKHGLLYYVNEYSEATQHH